MKNRGRIFMLDDDELIASTLSRILKTENYEVRTENHTKNVIEKISSWIPDIVLLDIKLPERSGIDILQEIKSNEIDTQVVMLTSDDTAETAVKAMKLGAVDYITKPFNVDEVKITINNILEKRLLKQEVDYLRRSHSEFFEKEIIGESEAIKEVLLKVRKMASAHVSTILITGESGAGKEVIARHIHYLIFNVNDTKKYSPFVSVNCAAMPETLLESELFGYYKGSFTNATSDKKGLFEIANGGSILLDEIGEMNQNLQSKLLRVLEERTIRRIGGKEEIPIDVVVIATTNKNLMEAIEKETFRSDLFFRLNTFYTHIPPLRERKEDILLLVKHYLSFYTNKYNRKETKGFSPEAEKFLLSYKWPGNIRELRNLIERLVVLESHEIIMPEHLPKWLTGQTSDEEQPLSRKKLSLPESGISLEELEKDLILQALEKAGHNKTQAAKLLDISYDSLRYQIKKFGLE